MLKTEAEARTIIEAIFDVRCKGWKYAGGQRDQAKNNADYTLDLVYVVPVIQDFDALSNDLEDAKLNNNMDLYFKSSQPSVLHGDMESEILFIHASIR